MNTGSYLLQQLRPDTIEMRLGQLIRRYLQQPSSAIAGSVAQHIETICAHPDYHGSWEERCAYRRLARHWRGLAWVNAEASLPPPVRTDVHRFSAVS